MNLGVPESPRELFYLQLSFSHTWRGDEVSRNCSRGCLVIKCTGVGKAKKGLGFLSESQQVKERTPRISCSSASTRSPAEGGALCSDGPAGVTLRTHKQVVTGSDDMARSSLCLPWTLYLSDIEGSHKTIVCNITVLSGPKCFPPA